MASLVITDDTLTVQMSLARAGALHRDLTVPRSAVTGVRGPAIVIDLAGQMSAESS